MTIVCVAIIGRENFPLYLKSFSSQTEEIKFYYVVHSALDLLAEKSMFFIYIIFIIFISSYLCLI